MKKRNKPTIDDRAAFYAAGAPYYYFTHDALKAGWLAGYRAAQRDARRKK